ncbi:adenylyl-sulfate kinase [Pseudidiomarina sp. 1APP75-27a]|uniref:adenylyl-sulfate kinase n=1 Tax=Pseudidiomarina terrestris TaxID=2820060 RepID=UPI002B05BDF3|nr:adenylyl-sulfate kinase [Pseudidiomarina sp. 1APP75-27a]MEA3587651.1 adenylyl-sulfate kinase [Pseudidiomarina sp. 1APP75-27a]
MSDEKSTENIVWHNHHVSRERRAEQKAQKPVVLWFTGLSGSGKSTIANAVDELLNRNSNHSYLLDGDNIRMGLNKGLGFNEADRVENIRRIGEVCKLFTDAGLIILSAFVSPFTEDRAKVRALMLENEFVEVFVDTPLEICEQRDPKGLYQKARKGEIPHFTGISSPYEKPEAAEIHLKTAELSIEEAAQQVLDYLRTHNYIS